VYIFEFKGGPDGKTFIFNTNIIQMNCLPPPSPLSLDVHVTLVHECYCLHESIMLQGTGLETRHVMRTVYTSSQQSNLTLVWSSLLHTCGTDTFT